MSLDVPKQINGWFREAFQALVDLDHLYRQVLGAGPGGADGRRLFTLRKVRSALEVVSKPEILVPNELPDDWRLERAAWERLLASLGGLLVALDLVGHTHPNVIPGRAKRHIEKAFREALRGLAGSMPAEIAREAAEVAVHACADAVMASLFDEKDPETQEAVIRAFQPVLDELLPGKAPGGVHMPEPPFSHGEDRPALPLSTRRNP